MIVKGRFVNLGQAQPLILDEDGTFDYSRFSRWVRYRWGLTVKKFKAQQRRELLAEKIRRLYRDSVKASEEEVKQDFVHKNTKVELSYVAFPPSDYRAKVVPTADELKAFIGKKKKEIEEYYETNKTAYEKLPAQVKLQAITVKFASEDKKAEAKARAEALAKRVAGGEDFGAVAREGSDDADYASKGGVLGWRNEDSPGLGEKSTAQVTKVKEGAVSELTEEKDSFVLFKVLGRRKGDLKLEQVQDEIAEQLFATDKALTLARADAAAFIKKARGGVKLEKLFTTEADKAAGDDDELKKGDEKVETKDAAEDGEDKKPEEATAEATDEATEEAAPAEPKKSPLELKATTAFTRSGQNLVPGIGVSKELAAAAFKLKEGEVADKPFEVGEMIYLVAVKHRTDADMGDWTKNKADLTETFLDAKAGELLRQYMARRCKDVADAGRVQVNTRMLVTPGYVQNKKDGALPQYKACGSLERQSLL